MTRESIMKAAGLTKLNLTENEIAETEKHLGFVTGCMEAVSELDTEDIAQTPFVRDIHNVFREDETSVWIERDVLLENAPSHVSGYYLVPLVVE